MPPRATFLYVSLAYLFHHRETDGWWGPRSQSRISRSANSTGCLRRRRRLSVTVRPPVPPSAVVETCHLRARHQFPTQLHFKDTVKRTRTIRREGRLTGNENELKVKARWMAPVSRTLLSLLCFNMVSVLLASCQIPH